MHRLEHRRVGPGRVDIPTGRQADTATYRRGQIGDDVAEQVVGDDHVEATRVGDHVDGGGVDVLVGHLDVRVAFADLVDGPQPQSPGEGQHVRFVHQCQMLATPSSPLERVGNHTPHTERGVHADFGGHLVGRADANRPAVAGVGSLGALAHHHEVDAGIAGQRAGHPRIQPGRTQVDVVILARSAVAATDRAPRRRLAPTGHRSPRAGSRRGCAARPPPSPAAPRRWHESAAHPGHSWFSGRPAQPRRAL